MRAINSVWLMQQHKVAFSPQDSLGAARITHCQEPLHHRSTNPTEQPQKVAFLRPIL